MFSGAVAPSRMYWNCRDLRHPETMSSSMKLGLGFPWISMDCNPNFPQQGPLQISPAAFVAPVTSIVCPTPWSGFLGSFLDKPIKRVHDKRLTRRTDDFSSIPGSPEKVGHDLERV